MQYIEASNTEKANHVSVFLAGGITNCPDWQSEAVKALVDEEVTLFNPRRKVYPMDDPNAAQEQIAWEFERLRSADIAAFWFSVGSLNPIVLFEFGSALEREQSIVVGVHPDYARKIDVEIQVALARPSVTVVSSFEEFILRIRIAVALCMSRKNPHSIEEGSERVAAALKMLRLYRQMTQKELGEKIGIPRGVISRVEMTGICSVSFLMRVVTVFGLTLKDFFVVAESLPKSYVRWILRLQCKKKKMEEKSNMDIVIRSSALFEHMSDEEVFEFARSVKKTLQERRYQHLLSEGPSDDEENKQVERLDGMLKKLEGVDSK